MKWAWIARQDSLIDKWYLWFWRFLIRIVMKMTVPIGHWNDKNLVYYQTQFKCDCLRSHAFISLSFSSQFSSSPVIIIPFWAL